MRQIEADIERRSPGAGFDEVEVTARPQPRVDARDWIGPEAGHEHWPTFGIAPPTSRSTTSSAPDATRARPEVVSRFGSTACKALMVCPRCGEPFDSFKEL